MDTFTIGTRVRLTHAVDRYPHFIAPKGSTGTVVDIGCNEIFAVRLDEKLDGAEDWMNEIHWSYDELDNVPDDLEVIA